MHVLAVDDEKIALELLVNSIMEYDIDISIHMFRNASKALDFAKNQECEVAFLDLHMSGMNGLDLAAELKKLNPTINIVFTTGFSEYALDAFDLHASGYIMKPITAEKVRIEMENLRNAQPVEGSQVRINCFGNFEIFINNKVVNFKYAKTKELLAYLVDRRGASCSSAEITNILWEDGKHDSYLRNIRKDLVDTLSECGCEDIVQTGRGKLNIQPGKVECDYYRWLEDATQVRYQGEYMAQYSWSEVTNAWLSQMTGVS